MSIDWKTWIEAKHPEAKPEWVVEANESENRCCLKPNISTGSLDRCGSKKTHGSINCIVSLV